MNTPNTSPSLPCDHDSMAVAAPLRVASDRACAALCASASSVGQHACLVRLLELLPQAIVDQHFHRRQRFNRLLSAVLDRPELIGIGIDEGTAVVVRNNALTVVGTSSRVWSPAEAPRSR